MGMGMGMPVAGVGSRLAGSQRLYMRPVPLLSLWGLNENEEKMFERVTEMFM